jgi:glutathione-regulated potassium-efflux system protein KefB
MRNAIFGVGGLQVALTGIALGGVAWVFGLPASAALFMGLALALSSTAFAVQVMEENGELTARHGRLGFAILLFQDLAAIPLLALASLFAVSKTAAAAPMLDFASVSRGFMVIAGIILVGRFVIDRVFGWIARAQLHEAMTALALLSIVTVVLVMEVAGLSASLGAFLAGVLLADSAYRHQIEADIKPFEGLLLGLFFTAIGMSLDVKLILAQPLLILALVAALVAIKAAVLYGLGRWQGLGPRASRRLAGSLSQGGEFAFVLFGAGAAANVLSAEQVAFGTLLVTLSMIATPAVLMAEKTVFAPEPKAAPAYDDLPERDQHLIIAGLGRFGQMIARVLRAKKIPFTALDIDPEHIEGLKRFGVKIYFGDASRLDILEAAGAAKATAFVLAIDDVEASVRTAGMVRRHFPDLPVYARARNRNHAHRLMELGIDVIHRETFAAALEMTRDVLKGLGFTERDAKQTVATFRKADEDRLLESFSHYDDDAKLAEIAHRHSEELERQFEADAADRAIAEGAASPVPLRKVAAE